MIMNVIFDKLFDLDAGSNSDDVHFVGALSCTGSIFTVTANQKPAISGTADSATTQEACQTNCIANVE